MPETLSSRDVTWDLGRLYSAIDDPAIARDHAAVEAGICALERHRGTIEAGIARHVSSVLEELEGVTRLWDRLASFAQLAACVAENDEAKVAFRERYDEISRRWQARVIFVSLEIQRIPEDRFARLLDDPVIAPYRHYVRHLKKLAPHTLSEKEEQVILKKNIAGKDALVRFREEYAAKMDFGRLTVDGEDREMTESELRALSIHPDPNTREAAARRIYETYARSQEIIHFLYSNIVKDHGIEREMRGYRRPIDVENLANEIELEIVEQAIAAARRHLPLVHEFFRWKGQILGLPRMRTCDRNAPITGRKPAPIRWDEGRRRIAEALERFDPEFEAIARRFFDERRIDAAVHKGKRGGGFCAPIQEEDPFILVNFTDDVDSVMTVAHELGHGVHFALARRAQRPIQAYGMSKVIAETASEFFEALLADYLIETSRDPVLERYLLGDEIDGFLGTVNRQLMFTEFELAAHAEAEKGPVRAEALSAHWERLSREYYGPHVDLLPGERIGWSTIPHFFFNPFYCVSYALSHVVVLALYARYKQAGRDFVPGYRELLAAGASGTPEELLKKPGIDLRDPRVYDDAYGEFARRVERLRALLAAEQ
jgi:oligoendopeptidase F